MNRPQKQRLGLQLPERRIGLNAHDFVQNAAGGKVWLTWSRKIGGTPAMPSRFVERLQMLCGKATLMDRELPALMASIDTPTPATTLAVPEPRPSSAYRPKRLSVSDVHMLQRDPYGYFAKRILKLRPLEPLAADPTAADRGNLIHAIAHRFVVERIRDPQADRRALFRRIADEQMASMAGGPAARAFLSGQLARLADYFIEIDAALSAGALTTLAEVEGEMKIEPEDAEPITVTARADRVDVFEDGVSIADYKTGTPPSTNDATAKFDPQLLLEALIAEKGGFSGLAEMPVREACFVKLSGRDIAGDHKVVRHLQDKIRNAEDGIHRLLAAYADEHQAYNAVIPESGYGDYDLLSRWKEWSSRLGDVSPGGADDAGQ
jgi:ATP-dependent helicase/nuclease subunit B